MPLSSSFTDEETAAMVDQRFFHTKARVVEKVRHQLTATHLALQHEAAGLSLVTPDDFNPANCHLVKGEHLEHFPYQYLDFPKYFHDAQACTFRSLFWWGHHLVFAWILEGRLIKQYKRHMVDRFHRIAGQGLELSMAPTLWEWKRGEGYTLPITHDRKAQIAAVLAERSFVKVARFHPLDDPRVCKGDLPLLAREAFRAMAPIVAA